MKRTTSSTTTWDNSETTIDLVGDCSDTSMRLYHRYYADEIDRNWWLNGNPERTLCPAWNPLLTIGINIFPSRHSRDEGAMNPKREWFGVARSRRGLGL